MITSEETTNDTVAAWFAGRLPQAWTTTPPQITVDREEIVVTITLDPVTLDEEASDAQHAEAAAGRISGWRAQTRDERIGIAQEAQRRFERKVSWGAAVGDQTALFTHLAVPAMTRLRQPQRRVLDTLVESGVARSRADALSWCVRLVGQHSDDWLSDLRSAMEQVEAVRDRGPA